MFRPSAVYKMPPIFTKRARPYPGMWPGIRARSLLGQAWAPPQRSPLVISAIAAPASATTSASRNAACMPLTNVW